MALAARRSDFDHLCWHCLTQSSGTIPVYTRSPVEPVCRYCITGRTIQARLRQLRVSLPTRINAAREPTESVVFSEVEGG